MTLEPATLPRSDSVSAGGLRLHYLDWGGPDGATPLLLLHGLTGNAGLWQRVAEALRDEYRVVALDQRGHGESEAPGAPAYATEDYVKDMEAVTAALGFERFVLVGHSMGGHNGMAFAARHPERLAALVVNDMPPALARPPRDELAQQFPGGEQPVFETREAWLAERRERNAFTPEWAFALQADTSLRVLDSGRYQPKANPHASIDWQPADLWEAVSALRVPMLVIRGGRSQVLDAETAMRMTMEISSARSVTLEKSGHNTFFDMEAEWLDVVRSFLAAHAR